MLINERANDSQKAPKAGNDWWIIRRKWEGSENNEQFKETSLQDLNLLTTLRKYNDPLPCL